MSQKCVCIIEFWHVTKVVVCLSPIIHDWDLVVPVKEGPERKKTTKKW